MTDENYTISTGRTPTEEREGTIRSMHARVENDLSGLRSERDDINAKIRVLVAEEDRLARMVRILDKAQEHDEADT